MACTTMAARGVAAQTVARPAGKVLQVAPLRAARAGRRAVKVSAAVKLDLHSNVFDKELVK